MGRSSEYMDAHTFQTLPLDEREQWAKRLKEQWQVELNEVAHFWFSGTVISGVMKYTGGAVTELLGSLDPE